MKIKGFYGPISWGHASFRFLTVRHHRTFKTLTGFVTLPVTEATSPNLVIKSFARNTPWIKVMQEGQVLAKDLITKFGDVASVTGRVTKPVNVLKVL